MEIGFYYFFDNGFNGLNMFVFMYWVMSNGCVVVADSDILFFYVGFNASNAIWFDGFFSK